MADVLAASQTHADRPVMHFIKVLHSLQFQEWDKQHLLSLLANAQSCVHDLCLDNVLIFYGVIFCWLALNGNDDFSLVLIILNGVLNDVKYDQLIFLPISFYQKFEGIFSVKVKL